MAMLLMNYYYKYPQFIWAKDIINILSRLKVSEQDAIIDAPCGNGVISYWLWQYGEERNMLLLDRDPECTAIAKNRIKSRSITVLTGDISELYRHEKQGNDVWLLINSLYLLPDPHFLVKRMKSRARYIIGVFPYINRKNFKSFVKSNPDYPHAVLMNKLQTLDFFRVNGYRNMLVTDSSKINHHCFGDIIYKSKWPLKFFNLFNPFVFSPAAYWIGVFGRNT